METMTKIEPLATPSDLEESGIERVADALNGLVADALALYIKTKNYHWHMSGRHFRDYHLLLDEQSDQILATVDPLAERVRKLGETTLRSVGHVAQLQKVKDDDRDFVEPREMLIALIEENKGMTHRMREAHTIADEAKDVATASLLEEYINQSEERVWFLFEASREVVNMS